MDNENCPARGCGGVLKWHRVIYGPKFTGRNAQPFTPITLFKDPQKPEGEFRVPGVDDEKTPDGHVRVEIKTIHEWERITKQMSAHGRAKAQEAYDERQRAVGIVKAELRAELRQEMQNWKLSDLPSHQAAMAEAAYKFAEYALAHSENKRPRPMPSGEVVAHALEYDSSNREAWRDARTGWKGRRS